MAPLVFPTLNGQGWSIKRRPTTSTRVASHVSGREVRRSLYAMPLYEFELNFEGLGSREVPQRNLAALGAIEDLQAVFIACAGQFTPFLFIDPGANACSSVAIATGDGATQAFTAMRKVGRAVLEPVSYLTSVGGVLVYPAGSYDDRGYATGDPVASVTDFNTASGTIDYGSALTAAGGPYTPTIVAPNQIMLGAIPPAGSTIVASFTYAFLCRFTDDQQEYENVMQGLWSVDSIKFRSVKP